MSDDTKKRPGKWVWWTLLALLVLYPITEGPVKGVVSRMHWDRGDDFCLAVYTPLMTACEHFDTVEAWREWYVRLCLPESEDW
jgi:hypothetical protein